MKFRKKISKKELIKTLQNNYEVILERKMNYTTKILNFKKK